MNEEKISIYKHKLTRARRQQNRLYHYILHSAACLAPHLQLLLLKFQLSFHNFWKALSGQRLSYRSHVNNNTLCGHQRHDHQSHYPDTELTGPCSTLVMLSARLGSNKCQFGE